MRDKIIDFYPTKESEVIEKILENKKGIYYQKHMTHHILDKTIIYGMDADLIMLSLNHLKYCNSIYLYRETPIFINSLDSTLDKNETYLLDIYRLGKEIYKEMN